MTIKDFYDLLATTEYPVTYEAWKTEDDVPPMPFICYRLVDTNNFGADNAVQVVINHFEVTLWTVGKDRAAEATLEAALSPIFWQKAETYEEGENAYAIIYDVEVIENGKQD